MNWIINLVGKVAGLSGALSKASPLLLALSAFFAAVSHVLQQAGTNASPADILALAKGQDWAVMALALKSVINHFRHEKKKAGNEG